MDLEKCLPPRKKKKHTHSPVVETLYAIEGVKEVFPTPNSNYTSLVDPIEKPADERKKNCRAWLNMMLKEPLPSIRIVWDDNCEWFQET